MRSRWKAGTRFEPVFVASAVALFLVLLVPEPWGLILAALAVLIGLVLVWRLPQEEYVIEDGRLAMVRGSRVMWSLPVLAVRGVSTSWVPYRSTAELVIESRTGRRYTFAVDADTAEMRQILGQMLAKHPHKLDVSKEAAKALGLAT